MNTLPGFTADASLANTSGRYQLLTAWAGGGAPVFPSSYPPFGCVRRCWCSKPGDPYVPGLRFCIEFDCQIHFEGTC